MSYLSQAPSTIGSVSCNPDGGTERLDQRRDNQFRVFHEGDKLVQSFLLLDSGAQLHARPIKCLGQHAPLFDPGIHTASGARLKHDGGRLVTFKLPEGRTIRVLFYAV